MKYREIVFLQGEDANEPLALLDKDEKECLDYLLQWDYGEAEERMVEPWGRDDRLINCPPYVISYNRCLNYIGLQEIIQS